MVGVEIREKLNENNGLPSWVGTPLLTLVSKYQTLDTHDTDECYISRTESITA